MHQAVDEEMDSHGSDDSETFTTPPGSIITGTDSDRVQTECPEGVEAMDDDRGDEEWKTIMPDVCINMISFVQMKFFFLLDLTITSFRSIFEGDTSIPVLQMTNLLP